MSRMDVMRALTLGLGATLLGWPARAGAQEREPRAAIAVEAGSVGYAAVRPVGVGVGQGTMRETLYPQDPADSLYRAARERLNRDEYRTAAELFREVRRRYPRSSYAAQAAYYEAFALYRSGREEELRAAQAALRELLSGNQASEATLAEARALEARIAGVLARRGDAAAAEGLARVAEAQARGEGRERGACQGEDEVRVAALNALLQMRSEQALPILEKVLANRSDDPCTVEMRRKSVFLLAQHLNDENVDILLDLARNDPDPEVRSQAVFWLSQVRGERSLEILEEILRQPGDEEVRRKALFAVSQHRSERATQILRDLALQEDADSELRGQAIFWLGQRRGAASVEFMRELYDRTADPALKEKVLFSLSQRRDPGIAEWLLGIAADTNEPLEMRKKAIFWASQSGISAEQVAGLYDRMPDRELKEQIIFGLSQSRSEAAVNKLLDIARNEEDRELRKKAIFWLGQSRDPRVAEALLQIIEGR